MVPVGRVRDFAKTTGTGSARASQIFKAAADRGAIKKTAAGYVAA